MASVEPLSKLRMSTVRGRAFLLFLAQLPTNPNERKRRQDLLAGDDARFIGRLFPKVSAELPANRVIAEPDELRTLRSVMQTGEGLTVKQAAVFGIPEEALGALPDQEEFIKVRSRWLKDEERRFIESILPLRTFPELAAHEVGGVLVRQVQHRGADSVTLQ